MWWSQAPADHTNPQIQPRASHIIQPYPALTFALSGSSRESTLFNCKYVPFAGDQNEEYSIDDVIYRSKNGGLLDVQHDMEPLPFTLLSTGRLSLERPQTVWPYGPACGQEGVGPPRNFGRRHRLHVRGQLQPLLGDRYGREVLGMNDLWVKQAATATPVLSRISV